jgi:hypothetical protein
VHRLCRFNVDEFPACLQPCTASHTLASKDPAKGHYATLTSSVIDNEYFDAIAEFLRDFAPRVLHLPHKITQFNTCQMVLN